MVPCQFSFYKVFIQRTMVSYKKWRNINVSKYFEDFGSDSHGYFKAYESGNR
jgi:hypothetical protein